MGDAKLGILLTADGSQLTKTLGSLESQLKRFQDALKNTQNVESFNRLQRAIDVTKSRIDLLRNSGAGAAQALDKIKGSANAANNVLINSGRIFQDLAFGPIGFLNNVNPAVEALQRLSVVAKETGQSVGGLLLKSLTGAGGLGFAFSLITSAATFATVGLSFFTRGMGGAKDEADKNSVAFTEMAAALDKITDSAKAAETQLQFLNRLGSINVKIFNLGDLEDLRQQSVALRQQGVTLVDQRSAALKSIKELQEKSNDDIGITQKERLDLEEKGAKSLNDIDEKINKNAQDQRIIYRQIQLQKNDDAKELQEKNKAAFEKFVNDTIAQAQLLEKAFGDIRVFPELEVDFNTNKQQVFENAKKVLKAFEDNNRNAETALKLILRPQLEIIPREIIIPEFSKEVTEAFEKAQNRLSSLKPTIQFSVQGTDVIKKIQDELKGKFGRLGEAFGIEFSKIFIGTVFQNIAKGQSLTKAIQNAGIQTAFLETSFAALADSTNKFFDSILNGGNVFKSFGDLIKNTFKQIAAEILKAIALAGILQLLTGGKQKFGATLAGLLGFRAEGGPVQAGRPYIVGERGPELVIPRMSGTVVPNTSLSSIQGFAGQMKVIVEGVIKGNDIVLSNNRTARRNNRNG
jgi:hypothetical protein